MLFKENEVCLKTTHCSFFQVICISAVRTIAIGYSCFSFACTGLSPLFSSNDSKAITLFLNGFALFVLLFSWSDIKDESDYMPQK